MSFRTLVLSFLFFALCVGASPAMAQGTDNLLRLLPNTERFWANKTLERDEFSEPLRGPAEISAAQNQYMDENGQARVRRQDGYDALYASYDPQQRMEKPSLLEDMYSDRIVDELDQFGYDLFGQAPSSPALALLGRNEENIRPSGAVQDSFVLGAGDELEIMFTGQRSERKIYQVNPQGMVLIEDFPPIPAAGRTIAQVKLSIGTAARNLHNTEAYVSLASVRQIGVLVVGHVKKPGRKNLNVFHTVLDALMQSGGVEKTGSLRQIKLVRDGRSMIVDIYGLLMHGSTSMDLNLRDGDRIIVPPIGPTVAISGEVKRPGIYEILPSLQGMRHAPEKTSQKLSLNDMLDFAGGVLSPGKNRFLKLEITDQGEENVSEVNAPFSPDFGDGSVLMVSKGDAKRSGTIELVGHTRRPGLHALSENATLSALLSSEDVLGDDIYPLIGLIERWDGDQLTHTLVSYPLRLVLKGDYDRSLQDGDVVHLFSNAQIEHLREGDAVEKDTDGMPKEKAQGSYNPDEDAGRIDDLSVASYLRERSAFIRGAVRKPGPYPVDQGVSLNSLLAVAGGLSLEANTHNIEITSDLLGEGIQEGRSSTTRRLTLDFAETNPKDVIIGPGNSVRVNQKFKKIEDKSVLIIGEVHHPGRYDLLPGDRLSDLLERAGSFTRQAYPEGAIFSRESERKAEEARFRAQAREIKRAVATALEMDSDKVGAGKIAEARALATELDEVQGVGRITVEADLAMLKAQPELDILLESGDRIFIPKRSLSVRVRGEVLSPASLQFRESKDPLNYIHEAGGFTFHADKDRAFVLYPDGSAQPLQVSPWNHKASFIPPGSTIIVPRDPEPFDFVQSAKEVSQILSNLAITALFIDDVTNGD